MQVSWSWWKTEYGNERPGTFAESGITDSTSPSPSPRLQSQQQQRSVAIESSVRVPALPSSHTRTATVRQQQRPHQVVSPFVLRSFARPQFLSPVPCEFLAVDAAVTSGGPRPLQYSRGRAGDGDAYPLCRSINIIRNSRRRTGGGAGRGRGGGGRATDRYRILILISTSSAAAAVERKKESAPKIEKNPVCFIFPGHPRVRVHG